MIRRRVLLGALLGALFALGWWVGGGRAASGLYSGLDLFVEVLQAVQTNYVDAVDTGKLMAGAMRGVAHGLDPWSRYLDPDEAKAARAAAPGAFDGIGAAVDVRGGWPVVIAPVEGSPAWDAGLEAGDVITKVNGRSMFGLTPDEVGAKLRGGTSAEVPLTVARDDKERDLRLPRRRAGVKNVPYAFMATPGVGYLRIAQFSSHAGDDVAAACDTLRRKGARALLMDLRGTPGGALDEAVATAAQFLPTGATIVSTKGRASGTDQRFRATRPHPELAWPLAVLVDGGSASAAEVVAGALQDHDRAVLVGDTTFGLGVVQQIYPLPGTLGALELTAATRASSITARTWRLSIRSVWNTPSGNPARRKMSSIASAHCGTLDACLSTATLPAMSAGAAKRNTCQNGKFHGITASTTPSGLKSTKLDRASVLTGSRARKRAAFSA